MHAHGTKEEKHHEADVFRTTILDALQHIKTIQTKYHAPQDHSPEYIHSLNTINAVEVVFQTVLDIYALLDKKNELSIKDTGFLVYHFKKFYSEIIKLYHHHTHVFMAIKADKKNIIQSVLKQGILPTDRQAFLATIIETVEANKIKYLQAAENYLDHFTSAAQSFNRIKTAIFQIAYDFSQVEDHDKIAGHFIALLYKNLFSSWHRTLNFSIHHPMMFDFYEAITPIIQKAPRELATLLPTLNPGILSFDCQNSPLMLLLGNFFGGVTFSFLNKEKTNNRSYLYEFTTYKGKRITFSEQYNCSQGYNDSITQLPEIFGEEKQAYCLKYANSPHVKTITIRSHLFYLLNTHFREFLKQHLHRHKKNCIDSINAPEVNPNNSVTTRLPRYDVDFIDRELSGIKSLIEENQKLSSMLNELNTCLDISNPKSIITFRSKFLFPFLSGLNITNDTFEADLSCFSAEEILTEIQFLKNLLTDEILELAKYPTILQSEQVRMQNEFATLKTFPEALKQNFIDNYPRFNNLQPSGFAELSEWTEDLSSPRYDKNQYIQELEEKIELGQTMLAAFKATENSFQTDLPNEFIQSAVKCFIEICDLVNKETDRLSNLLQKERAPAEKSPTSVSEQLSRYGKFAVTIPSPVAKTENDSSQYSFPRRGKVAEGRMGE